MSAMNVVIKTITLCLLCGLVLGCAKDLPLPINQEEVITTMTLTLTPATGTEVILQARDLDVDGPNPPVVTVSSDLVANTFYQGIIEFLDESDSPSDDITLEIKSEDQDHQIFYQVGAGANMGVTYEDQDGNGKPVGLAISVTTGTASTGTLTVTLRHKPFKDAVGVSTGDISNAGGETDAEQTFSVNIQ